MIKYKEAPDIRNRILHMVSKLDMLHISTERLRCMRSTGSQSDAIARCYALGKIWQQALDTKAHYVIEVIGERFDNLNEKEQDKVLIHELLHIPKSFGGGFRHHDYVCKRNIENLYKKLNKGAVSRFLKERLL